MSLPKTLAQSIEMSNEMTAFHKGNSEVPLKSDKYRFALTQSRQTLKAPKDGKAPKNIPMETRLYWSNTDKPLGIDESIQDAPEV